MEKKTKRKGKLALAELKTEERKGGRKNGRWEEGSVKWLHQD